jgi:hypothetical protein
MQELFDYWMSNCIVNDKGEIEFSLVKSIENWDLSELFTINNKGA